MKLNSYYARICLRWKNISAYCGTFVHLYVIHRPDHAMITANSHFELSHVIS